MLRHLDSEPRPPRRVVVIGAGGFVGGAVLARLRRDGLTVLGLARRDVDLLAPDAAERLAGLLRNGDCVVAAAALAPCKSLPMLRDNLALTQALVDGLSRRDLAQVINIGSDAVFIDQDHPLTEASPKAPDSYHGVMHLAREIAFRAEIKAPLAILRPTLIHGAGDPHNGYGPNQFRRTANRGEDITLFGAGEELRDHILIDDVAELVAAAVMRRSAGELNLATGTLTRFADIARLALDLAGKGGAMRTSPRSGPMPHNGYRAFDITALRDAFPGFTPCPLAEGMARAQAEEAAHG